MRYSFTCAHICIKDKKLNTVKLNLNNQDLEVDPNINLIQVAKNAGVEIPHYCYHSGLSVAGNCRMCLVEVEGMPKPVIACNTRIMDGMKVRTETDVIKKARQEVLEFLLVNHPLDCPVCDQAGECGLQNYYMEVGQYQATFFENKVKKKKAQVVGTNIMLDSERCILCSRCVRFCDEITKTNELGIVDRGHHSEIILNPGSFLENNYAGNVVDICPVGALTDKDFRFQMRVWYLKETPSICPGCSKGCNIEIHTSPERRRHSAEGHRVIRLKPRENPQVNQWWMCDTGRYAYKSIDASNRIKEPVYQKNNITWEKAFEVLKQSLDLQKSIYVLLNPGLTLEDLFSAKTFFNTLGIQNITANIPIGKEKGDGFLLQADRTPNRNGTKILNLHEGLALNEIITLARSGKINILYNCGVDLESHLSSTELKELSNKINFKIYQGTHTNSSSELSDLILPSAVYAEKEGHFVNMDMRLQRIHRAILPLDESKADWEIFTQLLFHFKITSSLMDLLQLQRELISQKPMLKGLDQEEFPEQGMLLDISQPSLASVGI